MYIIYCNTCNKVVNITVEEFETIEQVEEQSKAFEWCRCRDPKINKDKVMTKEQFLEAYNKYPPNGWIRFVYRYFSTSTTPKNSMLRKVVTGILITLFVCGMILSIIGVNYMITKVVTLAYGALLMSVVILILGTVWMNNIRIRRVAKHLGISLTEYNNYAAIWIEE